jgi:hypothetical protein
VPGGLLLFSPPGTGKSPHRAEFARYETGAILLFSNRPLEDWAQVLGDTAAAGALLDRFLHHADIIRLQGRSWKSSRSTTAPRSRQCQRSSTEGLDRKPSQAALWLRSLSAN